MPNGRCRLHGGFQHTAARRRLDYIQVLTNIHIDSFNTQPPEGGWILQTLCRFGLDVVSTHSRPKAAGRTWHVATSHLWFQHTAARRRLGPQKPAQRQDGEFQHTAARRRLANRERNLGLLASFNTQPPEGGWYFIQHFDSFLKLFQHTAARRRLASMLL